MISHWRKLEEHPVWDGWRKVVARTYRMPDGHNATFEIKEEGRIACVFGITPERRIIVVQQFRPGPGRVLLDLPGGFIMPGEDPLVAAKREFLEETGYEGEFQSIGTSFVDAYSTMRRYNFVATDCQKVTEPQLSGDEYVEVQEMFLPQFKKLLHSGRLISGEIGYRGLEFLNLLWD